MNPRGGAQYSGFLFRRWRCGWGCDLNRESRVLVVLDSDWAEVLRPWPYDLKLPAIFPGHLKLARIWPCHADLSDVSLGKFDLPGCLGCFLGRLFCTWSCLETPRTPLNRPEIVTGLVGVARLQNEITPKSFELSTAKRKMVQKVTAYVPVKHCFRCAVFLIGA